MLYMLGNMCLWIRIAINLKLILDRHPQFLLLVLWTCLWGSVGLYSWRGAAGGGKGRATTSWANQPKYRRRLGWEPSLSSCMLVPRFCVLSHLNRIFTLWREDLAVPVLRVVKSVLPLASIVWPSHQQVVCCLFGFWSLTHLGRSKSE